MEDKDFYRQILSSNILLLPRSNSGFSIYNQPLRLSEYMIFGKDILTANIDKQYFCISDKVNIYESSNKKSFKKFLYKLLIK